MRKTALGTAPTASFTFAPDVVRSVNNAVDLTEAQRAWRTAALASLSVRVIQGFIYWGGGSRRFIYAPSKLNPDATTWMANKFQRLQCPERCSAPII
jgi:thiosulfate dehydrogenase (quinone)